MKLHAALRIASLLLLLAAAAGVSFPQAAPPLQNKQDRRFKAYARVELAPKSLMRVRASELAATTADTASGWKDRKATVRVLAEAADLLWSDDPSRARAWLKRAWDAASEITDETADSAVARFRSNSPKSRGRGVVLAVAQRRDKAFADRLLEQLANEDRQADKTQRQGIFDDKTSRSEQLLDLALAVVKSDPNAATALAELSLADGISFRFQSVLLALREQDKGVADRLFDLALTRLASYPHELREVQVIASYLFTPGRVSGVGMDNLTAVALSTRMTTDGKTPAEADSMRARRFLNIVQRNLLSLPAPSATANPARYAQEIVSLASALEPGFKLYAPDLWLMVEQRMAAVLPDLAPPIESPLPASVKSKIERGNSAFASTAELNRQYMEGLEQAAEKESDPIARKFAYVRAALATSPEELPRGLKLAARISENELRQRLSSFLAYRAALAALDKGQLSEAINMASASEPLQHALVLVVAAQHLGKGQGDEDVIQATSRKARAVELLADAEKMLRSNAGSNEALRLRLGLVATLAPLDAPRALDFLRDTITDINQTDSFDPNDNSFPQVGISYGFSAQTPRAAFRSGFGLKDAFSALSQRNFDESVYIASKLKAAPTRGICMLEIARTVLTVGGISR